MRGKFLESLRHGGVWVVDGAVGEEGYVGRGDGLNCCADGLGEKVSERSELGEHGIEGRVAEDADGAIAALVAVTERALVYICRPVFGVALQVGELVAYSCSEHERAALPGLAVSVVGKEV